MPFLTFNEPEAMSSAKQDSVVRILRAKFEKVSAELAHRICSVATIVRLDVRIALAANAEPIDEIAKEVG